jgi:hypothetical protein
MAAGSTERTSGYLGDQIKHRVNQKSLVSRPAFGFILSGATPT